MDSASKFPQRPMINPVACFRVGVNYVHLGKIYFARGRPHAFQMRQSAMPRCFSLSLSGQALPHRNRGWLPPDPAADSGARKPVRRLEYFWLCDDCASQMTLARKNGEIVTVPREQMRAAATGS